MLPLPQINLLCCVSLNFPPLINKVKHVILFLYQLAGTLLVLIIIHKPHGELFPFIEEVQTRARMKDHTLLIDGRRNKGGKTRAQSVEPC
jgi:hypothetical protein